MSSDLVPVSDETAKAIQEGFKFSGQTLEAARAFGGYLSKILGTVPEDLVGLMFGDALHLKRAENLVRLAHRAEEHLKAAGVTQPEEVPISLGLPLLTAAADEDREELLELWSRLLAAAMNPARSRDVRLRYISIVKQMDPMDALVFDGMQIGPMRPNLRDGLAAKLQARPDMIEGSLLNLQRLDLIRPYGASNDRSLTDAFLIVDGRELARVLFS